MTQLRPPTCSACDTPVGAEAEYCLHCGASLKVQARESVAMDRVKLALADRYPVERRLGAGGMATVYLGRDPRHQREVAIKVLRPEIAAGVGGERFLREISVAASLQHPHILPLYDSGEVRLPGEDAILYYVMPHVRGESLRQRLDRERQLPVDQALLIAGEVAGALDYAHRQGVVHRDIKPENILLSEGHALVADFGIATAIGAAADSRITASGMAIGTPAYMSPEQATGETTRDGRGDIYSLGCVLYEMLAGEPPYTGPTAQSVMARRMSEPIPELATVREVSEEIDEVIRTALARVPADRYPTAGQMAAALDERRSSLAASLSGRFSVSPRRSSTSRPRPRPRWLVPAGAAGALAVLAVGAFALFGGKGQRGSASGISASRVAILPFGYHGGESGRDMSGALPSLLSSVLDGVGALRAVDPGAVLAAVGTESTAPDPDRARGVAARLGAARYVVGDVVDGGGDQVTITATAYDARGPIKRATVEGNARNQMFRLVNDLAVQLLSAFDIIESPRRVESISTASIVAMNEYLKGESALRGGDYPGAAAAFGRAVEADSLFALAWLRQADALIFTETPQKAERPMMRALALKERLSVRDRRLAEAFSAVMQVDPERADRLYRAIVYDYPEDIAGWFGRADVMLHFGPVYGLRMDSLSQAFERVLFLDPEVHQAEAKAHLPWAAALDGRIDLLDSATTASLAEDSAGFYAPVWRILRAVARRDSAAEAQALARQEGMDDLQRLLAVNMVGTMRDPVPTRRAALALFAAGGRLPEVRAVGHLMAAHLDLAQGRRRAAAGELAAADSLDPAAALEDAALLALIPSLQTPDSAVRALRARLERWRAPAGPTSVSGNPWVVPHDSLHAQVRLYLLGALSVRLGDGAAAQRHAAELRRLDTTTARGAIGAALAHQVLGQLALARNRPAEAVEEFDRGLLRGRHALTYQRAYASPFFSQAYERFLRARALEALGRRDEAERWYRSLWMANAFDLVYLAPAELGLAELFDRRGDQARALRHYREFVRLWTDADPPLRPAVARAEARIAALGR